MEIQRVLRPRVAPARAEEFLPSALLDGDWPRLDTPTHFTHRCDFERLRESLVSRVYVTIALLSQLM